MPSNIWIKTWIVLFLRYSDPRNQSRDSLDAQESQIRAALDRAGIDHRNALVLREGGIRGDLEGDSREEYARLVKMIHNKEVAVLAVDQQGRFSRGVNVEAMITDLVYDGGRFISADGLDTNNSGWQERVGLKQIQSRAELRDIGYRVRRQQEYLALDEDGCVGDYPYGYHSEFKDSQAALAPRSGGPKLRRRTILHQRAAAVVRLVFVLFAIRKWSFTKIAQYLNAKGESIPSTGIKPGAKWERYHLRKMLANTKYIGLWRFGETTTIRNSTGKRKAIPRRADQLTCETNRPHLAIIPKKTWDAAQVRLGKLKELYGLHEGQKRRGPRVHYSVLYPKTLLSGMIRCQVCGANLRIDGGAVVTKSYCCPNYRLNLCSNSCRLPKELAEQLVTKLLGEICLSYPAWVSECLGKLRELVQEARISNPNERKQLEVERRERELELHNVLQFIRKGNQSEALAGDLHRLEAAIHSLSREIADLHASSSVPVEVPDEHWVREHLKDFGQLLCKSLSETGPILRQIVGTVIAEPVYPPNRTFGYTRLHLKIAGFKMLAHACDPKLSPGIQAHLRSMVDTNACVEEFVIDVMAPTKREVHAATVVAMRDAGRTWPEISRATGISAGGASYLYKVAKAQGSDPMPPPKPSDPVEDKAA